VQPESESQPSVVQASKSSQTRPAVTVQPKTGKHLSRVQTLLSSQLASLGVLKQPVSVSQPSTVQCIPSSQSIGLFTHTPPAQLSTVHTLLSSQTNRRLLQQLGINVLTHVPDESQKSLVQRSSSSQLIGVPTQSQPSLSR